MFSTGQGPKGGQTQGGGPSAQALSFTPASPSQDTFLGLILPGDQEMLVGLRRDSSLVGQPSRGPAPTHISLLLPIPGDGSAAP